MSTHAQPAGRRALAPAAVAGACLTATLGLAVEQTRAASTPRVRARVHAGTLEITGNPGADTIALRVAPGGPAALQVDVGGDGTADFSFDTSTFTAINVQAADGADTVTGSKWIVTANTPAGRGGC